MTERRLPPPWSVERIAGGFKVIDANGQSPFQSVPYKHGPSMTRLST